MNLSDIKKEIESNLPMEIDGFQRRIATFGNLNNIIYTKSIKYAFKNIATSNNEIYDENEINKNVLYEVISDDLQICYEKMREKIFLNDKVKNDFKENGYLGFTSNLAVVNNGFKTFYKAFEVYIILNTDSDSQFFVVVSVNPLFDCKFIIETLSNLKQQFIEGSLVKLSNDEFNYSDFAPPKTIHLYSFDFFEKKNELKELFSKSGWNVKFRDNFYFENEKKRKMVKIILCEGENEKLLNNLNYENISFSQEHNSVTIFQNIKTKKRYALRDKDFLLTEEVQKLKIKFPKYYILEYYCIENFLYHPDNIEELKLKDFDKTDYIEDIRRQKNDSLNEIFSKIENIRNGYAELKENFKIKVKNDLEILKSELSSNDFDVFYKHYDMKSTYRKDFLMKFNLNQNKLGLTKWFKTKIRKQINNQTPNR